MRTNPDTKNKKKKIRTRRPGSCGFVLCDRLKVGPKGDPNKVTGGTQNWIGNRYLGIRSVITTTKSRRGRMDRFQRRLNTRFCGGKEKKMERGKKRSRQR